MKKTLLIVLSASFTLSILSLKGQVRSYAYDFENDTPGTIFSSSATFNYTQNNNSTTLAAGGTLIFRGNSASTDYVVFEIGGSKALRMQTALNTQTNDFGIYIGGLDFTDFASGDDKQVDFSFDILGNNVISTTDWEVNYTYGSSSAGYTPFTTVAPTDNVVFSFANSGSAFTTVTGTFIVPDGLGSSLGGLFISGPRNPDGTAALTGAGGSLAINNISVDVTAIPEPQTFAVLLGLISLGFVVARRRS